MTNSRLTSEREQWETLVQLQKHSLEVDLVELKKITERLTEKYSQYDSLKKEFDYALNLNHNDLVLMKCALDFLLLQNNKLIQIEHCINILESEKETQEATITSHFLLEKIIKSKHKLILNEIRYKATEEDELRVAHLFGVFYGIKP